MSLNPRQPERAADPAPIESPEEAIDRLRLRNRRAFRLRMAVLTGAFLIAATVHWRRDIGLWGVSEWRSMGGGPRISVDSAIERIYGDGALVVDVRTPEEFDISHLVGARTLPLKVLRETGWPASWPRNMPIVVYCTIGDRGNQAVESLMIAGVKAENVTGGLIAFVNRGEPIENEEGRTWKVHTGSEGLAWLLPSPCEATWGQN